MQPPGDKQGDENDAADGNQGYEDAALTEMSSPRLLVPRLIERRRRQTGRRIKAPGIGAALVVDALIHYRR
jgi:hypothetical protein